MHPILAECPEFVAVAERREALAEAERRHRERVASAMTPYREALATWRRDCEQAILDGRQPPTEPPAPDLGGDAGGPHLFQRERERLAAQEMATLADLAAEVAGAVGEREASLLKSARALTDKLAPIADELCELVRALRVTAAAAEVREWERTGRRVNPPPSTRLPVRVDVVDLVAAAVAGEPVLSPQPLPRPVVETDDVTVTIIGGRVQVDDDTRQLGLRGPRPFGEPPPPLPPAEAWRPGYI